MRHCRRMYRFGFVALAVRLLVSASASADEPPSKNLSQVKAENVGASHSRPAPGGEAPLERAQLVFAAGALGSPGQLGVVIDLGFRSRVHRYFAVGFDAGYGVLGNSLAVQDRWWLFPTAELVLPANRVNVEIGVGAGWGASSGYTSFAEYVDAPFDPVWAYQLVPAARAYVGLSTRISPSMEVFVHADFGGLVLGGTTIGSRVGNPMPAFMDLTWSSLVIGTRVGLK